jgi:hypothetical protein
MAIARQDFIIVMIAHAIIQDVMLINIKEQTCFAINNAQMELKPIKTIYVNHAQEMHVPKDYFMI